MWKLMENVASKIVEICSLIIDCRRIRECSIWMPTSFESCLECKFQGCDRYLQRQRWLWMTRHGQGSQDLFLPTACARRSFNTYCMSTLFLDQ